MSDIVQKFASRLNITAQTGGKARAPKEVRFYVVVKSNGKEEGVYKSKSGPSGAARKAARRMFTASTTKVRLTIRERGTQKTFTYDVARIKLPKPVIRKINGVEFKNEYTTKVKAVK